MRVGEILKKPIFEGLRERKSKGAFTFVARFVHCWVACCVVIFCAAAFLCRGCAAAPRIRCEVHASACEKLAGKI